MTDRAKLADAFLAGTDWANADRTLLAGDASNRRYQRLHHPNRTTAVFMDAPPSKGEDVRPFIEIAEHLINHGLSAPKILAMDPANGFLLLEDLGDDLFARVLSRQPALEETLYLNATEALIHLHQNEAPKLPIYDASIMSDLAGTAFSRYKTGIVGHENSDELHTFKTMFEPVLNDLTAGEAVLVQRDYHAENLLWLPCRSGVARVGMLDFQDAMLGHPAYDLVSVLQDARRDVSPEIEKQMLKHYVSRTNRDSVTFQAAYAALGAQRNLRIIGVFARLSLDMGKAQYVNLIPRVWDLLQRDLNHPAVQDIARFVRKALPEPTSDHLARLKPS